MKIKDFISYAVIILVVILIRSFIVTPIKVNGPSMNDTLQDKEIMILKKYDISYDRFKIVVFNYNGSRLIKRVIGMPKEDVEYKEGVLTINGKIVDDNFGKGTTEDFNDYCGDDEYFVLGDNREDSLDSRVFGCVSKDKILGTTNFVLFPFTKFGTVK